MNDCILYGDPRIIDQGVAQRLCWPGSPSANTKFEDDALIRGQPDMGRQQRDVFRQHIRFRTRNRCVTICEQLSKVGPDGSRDTFLSETIHFRIPGEPQIVVFDPAGKLLSHNAVGGKAVCHLERQVNQVPLLVFLRHATSIVMDPI